MSVPAHVRTSSLDDGNWRQPGLKAGLLAASLCLLGACSNLPAPLSDEERAREEKLAADEAQRQAQRPAQLCRAEAGTPFALRKKILLLAMPIARPAEAADLPGISLAWPQALQHELAASPHFLVRDGSAHVLEVGLGPNAATATAEEIIALARRFDAQFVIAGYIDSLAIAPGQIEFKHLSELTRLRPIPLSMLDMRSIITHIDLYDGISGSRLSQLRQQEEVDTEVRNKHPGVMQGSFFNSKLGAALATVLKRQAEEIEDELACLPMMATARRMPDGRISIAAGFNSGLQPGQRLRLFLEQVLPVNALRQRPHENAPFGEVLIDQVYPEHAIAHLDSALQPAWQGQALVRAW